MSDTEVSIGDLLDTLAALDPAQRRELATTLRRVADNLAEVPDGKTASRAGRYRPNGRPELTCPENSLKRPHLRHRARRSEPVPFAEVELSHKSVSEMLVSLAVWQHLRHSP